MSRWPRRRIRPVCAALLLVTAAAPFTTATAAAPGGTGAADEEASERWFYTEVLIFQRAAALEAFSEESLLSREQPRFPDRLRALQPLTGDHDPEPDSRSGQQWCFDYPESAPHPEAFTDRRNVFGDPGRTDGAVPWSIDGARAHDLEDDLKDDLEDDLEDDLDYADAAASDDAASHDADPRARAAPEIRPQLAADPVIDFMAELARYQATLQPRSYRWLDDQPLGLAAAARRLSQNAGYQVLLHGRWLQPVPERERPEPILIQAGERLGESWQLEGMLDVTVARFLHFRADLWYQEPLQGRAPLRAALMPAGFSGPAAAPELELTPTGYIALRESRRVRSGELHYLDHPKLGILVRIEPLELPDALRQRRLQLEQDGIVEERLQ